MPDVVDEPEVLLTPHLELLKEQYVLVHAWKKTAAYIRYHNWYADTLEIDLAAINLPTFLHDVAERLADPTNWKNDTIRIVPGSKKPELACERQRTLGAHSNKAVRGTANKATRSRVSQRPGRCNRDYDVHCRPC